jgi:hypothetical protein
LSPGNPANSFDRERVEFRNAYLPLEVREVIESGNRFDAGGCSTEQTPDDLTSRIALLGDKHNASMRPALAQPVPMKLCEVARVCREK